MWFILNCLFFSRLLLFHVVAVILNPNDFDFLLSRGNSTGHINPRDSILERFDPILGRKSVAPSALINRLEPSPETTTPPTATNVPNISTIREVDSYFESSSPKCANDQLISIKQSPATSHPSASINEHNSGSGNSNNTTVKLASAEKTDLYNSISGDGDNSLASSTTETYETASIGEPLKVSDLLHTLE